MRSGHQRGRGPAQSGAERQQQSQHNGARGYQGSDYNSRGDARGHGMREYHQPDYAQRDFSQRDFNERGLQHRDFGPTDQRGEPVRDYGPTFGDDRGNQFDGRSDGNGGRGTHASGRGHMDWSTGQDWNARSSDSEDRSTRGLGWERAGDTMSQPRPNVAQSAGHRGKGPKGFKRSDERIRDAVSEALHDDDDVDASDISVEVKDGEVILTGTVADRRTKRLAEEVVEALPGVHDVVNQIRVKRGEESAREDSDRAQTGPRNGTSGGKSAQF